MVTVPRTRVAPSIDPRAPACDTGGAAFAPAALGYTSRQAVLKARTMSQIDAHFPPARWRLIVDRDTRTGAENMALDEAIMEAVAAGDSPPTLRFYQWAPPCLSLG